MPKPELGTKRICVACGARFYDLGKVPAVCPKCGAEQPADQPRLRRAAPPPEDKRKVAPAGSDPDADDVEVEGMEDDEAGDDDSVIEDTSDLEGGADDLGEDIEVEKDDPDSER